MFLQAETQFGLDFLRTLPAHNESLVFSPLSIALALALIHTGAREKSKEQIGDVLLNGASDDQFISHFSYVVEDFKKATNGLEVNVANKIFLKKGVTVNPSFLSTALKNYGASAQSLDMTIPSGAKEINQFVKESTKGKIDGIVTENSIKDAVAVVVNAIYFKGKWEDNFDPFSTSTEDFTQHTGKPRQIQFLKDFMSDRGYSSDEIFQVLHVSYADQRFQFSIFLPKKRNSLKEALEKLDAKRFQDLMKNVKSTFMNTKFPKFTVEKEMSLKKTLEKLGITEIFSDNANLSGLADKIKISDGAHKALIEVNEEGTIAAAATMAKAVPMSLRMETPVEFNADHPFLFALTHWNHPIFLGVFN